MLVLTKDFTAVVEHFFTNHHAKLAASIVQYLITKPRKHRADKRIGRMTPGKKEILKCSKQKQYTNLNLTQKAKRNTNQQKTDESKAAHRVNLMQLAAANVPAHLQVRGVNNR